MKLEEYEEELAKQQNKHENIIPRQFDGVDGRVLTYNEMYPERTNWGNIEPVLDPTFQREIMAQYAQEDANLVYRHHNRQSGRTTRMLLSAIGELSEGKRIIVCAPTHGIFRNLRNITMRLLEELGMRSFARDITFIALDNEGRAMLGINRANTRIYYDHTCNEM